MNGTATRELPSSGFLAHLTVGGHLLEVRDIKDKSGKTFRTVAKVAAIGLTVELAVETCPGFVGSADSPKISEHVIVDAQMRAGFDGRPFFQALHWERYAPPVAAPAGGGTPGRAAASSR